MNKIKFCVLVILLSIVSCDMLKDESKKRAYKAEEGDGDITIGAVAPWSSMEELLWNGIEFAVEEINRAGGVLNRKIRIIKEDDEAAVTKGRIIAQNFAENLDIVAVIGHFNSYVSIPVSSTYEFAKILMMSPASTSPKLTQQGFKYVFRNIPHDGEIAKQLADFAHKKNYKKIIIYYINTSYGLGLANSFEKRIEEITDMEIVYRISYDPEGRNEYFRTTIRNWKDIEFDAIFLAGEVPKAGEIIAQIRDLGIDAPIFGGDGLDSSELWKVGGEAVEGTIVTSFFNPNEPRKEVKQFNEKFRKKYGVMPDTWAVQGYDAVYLLANAMKKANSSVPEKMAEALRSTRKWQGVSGIYSFNKNGDVVGKPIIKKIVRNKHFEFIE